MPTVYRLAAAGVLPFCRVGGALRFRYQLVERYLDQSGSKKGTNETPSPDN